VGRRPIGSMVMPCQGPVGGSVLVIGSGTWNSPTTWHPWHDLQTLRPPDLCPLARPHHNDALVSFMGVRRKTFPLRTSGITFLESRKTSLPHTHTHTHTQFLFDTQTYGRLTTRSVPTKDVLSLPSYLRILVRNKFHLFGCQKNRHALPGSHSEKVNCHSAGVWVKLDWVLIPHLQYLPFQTDRPVCSSILLPSESTVQYLQIDK